MRFFVCTGVLVKCPLTNGGTRTVIVTSASLVRGHDKEYYIDSLRCGDSGVGCHDDDDHITNLRVGAPCFATAVLLRCCSSLITVLFAD